MRFFHNSLKARYRNNVISVYEGEERKVEGIEEVKKGVKNHFEKFFKEEDFNRALPKALVFNCLNEEDRKWLDRPFSVEEVKGAVVMEIKA